MIAVWVPTPQHLLDIKKYFPYSNSVPEPLRAPARIAALVGAVGSLIFLFHASPGRPRTLTAIFVIWVLLPFAALVLTDVLAKSWPALVRATLHRATLVVALGSLAFYGYDALRPRKAQAAFVYVMVPPVSCLLAATAVAAAAFVSIERKR